MRIEIINQNGKHLLNRTLILSLDEEETFSSYLIDRIYRYERDMGFRDTVEEEYMEAMADLQGDADYHAMMEASGPPEEYY